MFQSPTPTQYDLAFSVLGFPVRVHPMFWLITVLLGSSGSLLQIPLWVGVVFISILIHELGHALAFRRYGIDSQIVLHFGGGLTIPMSSAWGGGYATVQPSPFQHIIISLAGPFAGFIFAALTVTFVVFIGGSVVVTWLFGLIPMPVNPVLPFGGEALRILVALILWVNVFWGLINLLPVFPLDGGQVARNIFIQYDPWNGVRKSLWLSVSTGAVLALVGLVAFGSVYMALLFGLLAFQSYQALQVRY